MWLNVRNPICLQLRGRGPYQLFLRVRFFVDPKLLRTSKSRYVCPSRTLCDACDLWYDTAWIARCRNLFFHQLYDDLVKGTRFHFDPMDDMSKAIYLGGLIAQMEHGDISRFTGDTIVYRQYFSGLTQKAIQQEHRRNLGILAVIVWKRFNQSYPFVRSNTSRS
jgi:hypothetical protein